MSLAPSRPVDKNGKHSWRPLSSPPDDDKGRVDQIVRRDALSAIFNHNDFGDNTSGESDDLLGGSEPPRLVTDTGREMKSVIFARSPQVELNENMPPLVSHPVADIGVMASVGGDEAVPVRVDGDNLDQLKLPGKESYRISDVAKITGKSVEYLSFLISEHKFPFSRAVSDHRKRKPHEFTYRDVDKLCRFLEFQERGHSTPDAIIMVMTQDVEAGQKIVRTGMIYLDQPTAETKETAMESVLSLPALSDLERQVLRLTMQGVSLRDCARAAKLSSANEARAILYQAYGRLGQAIAVMFVPQAIDDSDGH